MKESIKPAIKIVSRTNDLKWGFLQLDLFLMTMELVLAAFHVLVIIEDNHESNQPYFQISSCGIRSHSPGY